MDSVRMRRDSGATRSLIEGVNSGLLFLEVRAVLLVFIAKGLQNVAVWNQELRDLYRDWFEVHLGVLDGHLQVHMAEIAAVKALLKAQSLAAGMSEAIQPALIVESRRIHHERIAFPMPNRIAEPRRVGISGKLAPIRVYLAVRVIHLVQDHGHSARLNDLKGSICEHIGARDAERQAARDRSNSARCVLPKQFGGFGPNGRFRGFEVRQDVPEIFVEGAGVVSRHYEETFVTEHTFAGRHRLGLPDSGKVGLAIGGARRLRRKVSFAVPHPGSPRRGIVQPLGVCTHHRSSKHDSDSLFLTAHTLLPYGPS